VDWRCCAWPGRRDRCGGRDSPRSGIRPIDESIDDPGRRGGHQIAAGDTAATRPLRRLASLAVEHPSPWLSAIAAQAHGTLLLAEGDPRAAIARLREAWMAWQELEAPYEAARVRVAMGLAHRATGDEEAAGLEFDAAERICERLGAAPELRRIERLGRAPHTIAGLTPRARDSPAVATGMTNRAIARELFISERTVDREQHPH
jgi:DNA-binding NarL/FixJ family response regulator